MDLDTGGQIQRVAGRGCKPPQHAGEQRFERRRRNPADARVVLATATPLQQRRRDVVAVAIPAAAIAERGRHRLAVDIEDAAGQRGAGHAVPPHRPLLPVGRELALHRLEELGLDDRRMHARVDLGPVHDHPEVSAVAQQVEERPAIERSAILEAELRRPLLVRRKRGVTPTAANTALYRHARLILRRSSDGGGEASQFDWSHEVVLIAGVTVMVELAQGRLPQPYAVRAAGGRQLGGEVHLASHRRLRERGSLAHSAGEYVRFVGGWCPLFAF